MPFAPLLKCRTTGWSSNERHMAGLSNTERYSGSSLQKFPTKPRSQMTYRDKLGSPNAGIVRPLRSSGTMPKRKSSKSSNAGSSTTHQNNKKYANGDIKTKHSDQSVSQLSTPVQVVSLVVVGVAVLGFLQLDFQNLFGGNKNVPAPSSSPSPNKMSQKSSKGITSWRKANQNTMDKFGTSICTVDRRDANSLSVEEFERVYRHKKPVIVKFPNGANDWTVPKSWSLQSLKQEYGQWSILSGNSREIVRKGGNGDIETSFTEYVDSLMRSKDNIDEPFYVFDRSFYNDSSLPQTLHPPKYLEIKDGIDDSIFFLGSSGSGVTFHKHADAWNGVIYGQKRWFLYLIDQTPPGGVYPGYTQIEWFNKIYPNLTEAEKPLECVQQAGEILYLPEGTYHGTINLGDTVAIGIQKKEASIEAEKLFYNVLYTDQKKMSSQKKSKKRIEIFEKLSKLLPENTEVMMKLGQEYSESGQLQKALELEQLAVEKDPYFIIAQINKGKTLWKLGRLEEAEKTLRIAVKLNPTLWDTFATFGDFLINNGRPKEAAEMFKQGTILKPDLIPFWNYLKRAQEESGDTEAAAKTARHIEYLQSHQGQR